MTEEENYVHGLEDLVLLRMNYPSSLQRATKRIQYNVRYV